MPSTRKRLWRAVTSVLAALAVTLSLAAGSAGAEPAGSGEPTSGPARFADGFQHGKVQVNGSVIHYVRGGSGPPLVLIHGWPETWWAWHKVMPALARKHTVIAVDLPGLGDSTAPPSGYDKATTALRIREAVRKLGFTNVGIVAHDMGVSIAYPWARDHPGEVSRIAVMESPLPGFGLDDLNAFTWHIEFNQMRKPVPEQIVDNDDVKPFYGSIYDATRHPDAIDRERYYQAYVDPADRSAGFDYYRAFTADAADNRANASKRLRMPVLAMGGQYSMQSLVAQSFRNVADDVREVIAPDSGHFIPEENPKFTTDQVLAFFSS
ncbi:alpha/beta fold hydrolase [Actinomadura rudentiformis]|uniref:Alpha/beta hydrolase n=1 Tax=Actinomadura rudentiformis TaxID=359158 RepID=A0A6H9Y7I2_9ACTN|nr:alpha/beta hydrolase [Actinomadura rudentiformis]KAB2340600.1 alpha/beta hydrolase [Actinomadura rudentiformis]